VAPVNILVSSRLVERRRKLGEQLVDALGLVVMDPVRIVGQALDAIEFHRAARQ
jgi:hypothetical protein